MPDLDFLRFMLAQDSVNPLWIPALAISMSGAAIFLFLRGESLSVLLPPNVETFRADLLLWLTGRLSVYLLVPAIPVLAIGGVIEFMGDSDGRAPGVVGWAVFSVGHFLWSDFSFWSMHWIRHKVPILWALHIVHHSARHLNPLTNYRRHPLEPLWLAIGVGGMRAMPFFVLVGLYPGVQAGGMLLTTVATAVFVLTWANLQHTHVWMSFGPTLEHLLVSPAMHQVHHSTVPRESLSNFGQMLAVWDWMFGTLITADQVDRSSLEVGVVGVQHLTLRELFVDPLTGVLREFRAPEVR